MGKDPILSEVLSKAKPILKPIPFPSDARISVVAGGNGAGDDAGDVKTGEQANKQFEEPRGRVSESLQPRRSLAQAQ
ncbi:hypothetical protein HDU76_002515 [Blyttiomyces sp. JEL0837]|nr:hypothetical protein HDU76_002515 [Blyttiomyces sp. JEL0837]